jgi:hypothetical protein
VPDEPKSPLISVTAGRRDKKVKVAAAIEYRPVADLEDHVPGSGPLAVVQVFVPRPTVNVAVLPPLLEVGKQ